MSLSTYLKQNTNLSITDNRIIQDMASGVLRNTLRIKFQKTSGEGNAGKKRVVRAILGLNYKVYFHVTKTFFVPNSSEVLHL